MIHRPSLEALRIACGLPEESADAAAELAARVLECVSDALVFVDSAGRCRYVNRRAAALLDRGPEQLLGAVLWSELEATVGDALRTACERAWAMQHIERLEVYHRDLERWLEHRIQPGLSGAVIAIQDASERRQREAARSSAEAEQRQWAELSAQAERLARLGFWHWDVKTNRVTWSPELYRIYGLDAETFGASFEAYLARVEPADRERVRALIAGALAHGGALTFDERIARPDGAVRQLRSWATVRRDGAGDAVAMVGTCLDITELLETTDALRRSEQWLKIALDGAQMGLWDWQIESGTVHWSEGVAGLFGLGPGGFGGTFEAFLAAVADDDRARVEATLRECVRGETDCSFDHRVRWPDGSVRWLAVKARVFRGASGAATHVAGSVMDVTDARRAAEERRKFQLLVENATDFIALVSLDGSLLYLNAAGRRLVGLAADADVTTLHVGDLLSAEGLRASLEVELREVMEQGRWEGEGQLVHRETGAAIDVLAASFIVREPADGAPLCLATVRKDVTARRALEGALRQSQKLEAIGRLAAGVAHDFNNLLTIIGGMTGLAGRDRALGASTRRFLAEADGAVKRGAVLTRQLLSFSRPQAARPVVLDLNALVTETAALLARLLPAEVELRTELSPVALAVRADRGHLEQVLVNLVVNARDAMPQGGALTIATVDRGERVALSVADTGTGMSAEVRARIFEPFYTTKEDGRGTGLGLSTVQGIVRECGGAIELTTAPGAGSTFTVVLDRSRLPITPRGDDAHAAAPGQARETVLVVEHESAVRAAVRSMLEAEGYRVLDTGSAENALRIARSHGAALDLLVTDVHLPRIDGRDLSRQLREAVPTLKTLYLSTVDGDEPDGPVLSKPFAAETLTQRVRAALESQPVPAAQSAPE